MVVSAFCFVYCVWDKDCLHTSRNFVRGSLVRRKGVLLRLRSDERENMMSTESSLVNQTIECPLCLGEGKLKRTEVLDRLGVKDFARDGYFSFDFHACG